MIIIKYIIFICIIFLYNYIYGYEQQLYPKYNRTLRMECIYYQNIGCFSDMIEKICNNEIKTILMKNSAESIYSCCCPLPYLPCNNSQVDQNCLNLVENHIIKPFGIKWQRKDSFKNGISHAIQNIRRILIESDINKCLPRFYLPEKGHYVGCGPAGYKIDSNPFLCEVLHWQFYELGDGTYGEMEMADCILPPQEDRYNGISRTGTGLLQKSSNNIDNNDDDDVQENDDDDDDSFIEYRHHNKRRYHEEL